MARLCGQRGSALLIVIGLTAALAILAGSLVILTVNVEGNSSRDRQKTKSFNVSEAALNAALFKLASAWPTDEAHAIAWTEADETGFRDQFDTGLFPDPSEGSFSSVTFYDNSDTNGDGLIGPGDATYDAGPGSLGDGLMYVEAQAGVGKRATRLQAEVERVNWDNLVPRGIAVAADGEIYANNHKQPVGVEYIAPDQDYIVIKSGVEIDEDVYQPDIVPQEELPLPVVDSVMDPTIILELIDMAKANGSYYSGSARPGDMEEWEGLVVIQTTGTVDLDNQDDLNSDGVGTNAPPGILIVVGPNYPSGPPSGGIDVNGHGEYWGLVYTDGSWRNSGTSELHGMLMAKGTVTSRAVEMQGDRDVLYNDNCIQNLNNLVVLNARIVPNSWREITPIAGQ